MSRVMRFTGAVSKHILHTRVIAARPSAKVVSRPAHHLWTLKGSAGEEAILRFCWEEAIFRQMSYTPRWVSFN